MIPYLILIAIFIISISYYENFFGLLKKEGARRVKTQTNVSVKPNQIIKENKLLNTEHDYSERKSFKNTATKLLTCNPRKISSSISSDSTCFKMKSGKASFCTANSNQKQSLLNSKNTGKAKTYTKSEVNISMKRAPRRFSSSFSCQSSNNSCYSSSQQFCNCRTFNQKKYSRGPLNYPSIELATKFSKDKFKSKEHESENSNAKIEMGFLNEKTHFRSRIDITSASKRRIDEIPASLEHGDMMIYTSNLNNNHCSTLCSDDGKSSFEDDSLEEEDMKSNSAEITLTSDFCKKIIKAMSPKVLKIGKYRCFHEIGRGSFGKVLFALCKSNTNGHSEYAIKLMDKRVGHFKTETMILKMVKNIPFFVHLEELLQTKQYLCFVLTYESRGCLRDQIGFEDRRKYSRGEAAFYSGCVTMALNYLHSKEILHGDVKPDNILIDSDGYPKLTDFGMSIPFFGDDKEIPVKTGTPYYMSPEMFYGELVTKATDFYSLAITIYELMSGETPREFRFYQQNEKPKTMTINLDRITNHFLSRMLRKNKNERLGYGPNGGHDILMHDFFEGLDWNKALNRNIKAPSASRQDLEPHQVISFEYEKSFDRERDETNFSDFRFVSISYVR